MEQKSRTKFLQWPGFEPRTSRLVDQHANHWATAQPQLLEMVQYVNLSHGWSVAICQENVRLDIKVVEGPRRHSVSCDLNFSLYDFSMKLLSLVSSYCSIDSFQENEPVPIPLTKFDAKKQDELKRLNNLKV